MVGGNAAVKTISKSTKDKSFLQVWIILLFVYMHEKQGPMQK